MYGVQPFSGNSFKMGSLDLPKPTKSVPRDSFHFDALHSFSSMIRSYDSKTTSCQTTFKAEVVCRIFQVAQTAAILVIHILKQIVRMVTALVSGVLTLDHNRISFAINDLISIPIQVFLLPLLSFVALFSPQYAAELSDDVAEGLNSSKLSFPLGENNVYAQYLKAENGSCGQKVSLHLIERLTLPLQVFLTALSRMAADILSFNFNLQSVKNMGVLLASPLFFFIPQIEGYCRMYGGIVPGAN